LKAERDTQSPGGFFGVSGGQKQAREKRMHGGPAGCSRRFTGRRIVGLGQTPALAEIGQTAGDALAQSGVASIGGMNLAQGDQGQLRVAVSVDRLL